MKEKIGLFGGSFDPLHFGHLNLAIDMMELRGLDAVWFCPAKISPFKLNDAPAVNAHLRLEMLKLALDEIPHFKALDIEVEREGPSYTVDTLKELHQEYPDKEFFMILGSDSVKHFFKWHQPEEIASLAKLLIGKRGNERLHYEGSEKIQQAIQEGITNTRNIEISSTEVRKRLKEKKFCSHLVPAKVMDYISEHRLYL